VARGRGARSIELILALLAGLAVGPLRVPMPDSPARWRIGLAAIESPRGAAIHWCAQMPRTCRALPPELGQLRELARGPLAAQTSIIPDFPLVNKELRTLCYSCTDR